MSTSCAWEGKKQVWLIPLGGKTQSVQVKLLYPFTMRAIPERLRDVSFIGAIQIDILFITLPPGSYYVPAP